MAAPPTQAGTRPDRGRPGRSCPRRARLRTSPSISLGRHLAAQRVQRGRCPAAPPRPGGPGHRAGRGHRGPHPRRGVVGRRPRGVRVRRAAVSTASAAFGGTAAHAWSRAWQHPVRESGVVLRAGPPRRPAARSARRRPWPCSRTAPPPPRRAARCPSSCRPRGARCRCGSQEPPPRWRTVFAFPPGLKSCPAAPATACAGGHTGQRTTAAVPRTGERGKPARPAAPVRGFVPVSEDYGR